jgi:hypothetical protein
MDFAFPFSVLQEHTVCFYVFFCLHFVWSMQIQVKRSVDQDETLSYQLSGSVSLAGDIGWDGNSCAYRE